MAEREGFEPSVHLLGVHTISSRAPSASSGISPFTFFLAPKVHFPRKDPERQEPIGMGY